MFAVKRGKCRTTFTSPSAAFTYWRSVLGAVLLEKTARGWERV